MDILAAILCEESVTSLQPLYSLQDSRQSTSLLQALPVSVVRLTLQQHLVLLWEPVLMTCTIHHTLGHADTIHHTLVRLTPYTTHWVMLPPPQTDTMHQTLSQTDSRHHTLGHLHHAPHTWSHLHHTLGHLHCAPHARSD